MRTWIHISGEMDPAVEIDRKMPDSELSLVKLTLDKRRAIGFAMSWTELDDLHLVLTDALAEHEIRKAAQLALYDAREL